MLYVVIGMAVRGDSACGNNHAKEYASLSCCVMKSHISEVIQHGPAMSKSHQRSSQKKASTSSRQ